MHNFKQRLLSAWQQRQAREQKALLALAGFLTLSAFYLLLWQPQQHALALAQVRYQDEVEVFDIISRLPPSLPGAKPGVPAGDLPGLLARSSAQANLDLQRMDTGTQQQVSLELAGNLANLLTWLEALGREGVNVTTLSLTVSDTAQARSRLVLEAR